MNQAGQGRGEQSAVFVRLRRLSAKQGCISAACTFAADLPDALAFALALAFLAVIPSGICFSAPILLSSPASTSATASVSSIPPPHLAVVFWLDGSARRQRRGHRARIVYRVPSVKDHEATLRASDTTDQAVAFRDLEEE